MRRAMLGLVFAATVLMAQGPEFTADGKLVFPANYREWIFLSSGLGMSYGVRSGGDSAFDNVFVSPPSYREFLATGRWPEKTMFVLEIREASSHGSINKAGHFQSDLIAVEAEVKDSARFPEKWAFFPFGATPGNPGKAQAIPAGSACQACHSKNGAVDNTFVQFYPTLLDTAKRHGTLKASYEPPAPTPSKFFQIVSERGWTEAQKAYQEAKQKDPEASLFQESSLNLLGYRFLQAKKKPEAIAVFEMVAASYPRSANAYDSLAEAYEDAGQTERAVASSKKVLELLPGDSAIDPERRERIRKSSESRIEKLKGTF